MPNARKRQVSSATRTAVVFQKKTMPKAGKEYPRKGDYFAMKEILKLWYFGCFKKDRFKIYTISALVFLFSYIVIVAFIIPSRTTEEVFIGYIMLGIINAGFCMVLWIDGVGQLLAIVKFKRHFSFLPPATNEGRIAMKSNVDFELHQAAIRFILMCKEEEKLVNELTSTAVHTDLTKILTPQEIMAIEKTLAGLRKDLAILKKQFWQKHAAAKNSDLPAPFEVYPSIHNYETNPPQKTVPKKRQKSSPVAAGHGRIL